MFYSSKIRLSMLSCLMLLLGLSLSVAPALADGNVLRSFEPPVILTSHVVIYFPLGITFDGTNLYYSQPATVRGDIFHITTTTGTLLNTLKAVNMAGSLAWDGSHLWVGIAAQTLVTCEPKTKGCALLSKVDVSTDTLIKTVDISSVFAADHECNFIDGLSFDPSTGSLWVSPDPGCLGRNACSVGFVYNVDTSGKLIKRLQFPFGVSGVAVVGTHLYVVNRCALIINETDTNGQIISSFPMTVINKGNWVESIGFDPVTFAPACALWAMQPYFVPSTTFDADLVAYQIGCP